MARYCTDDDIRTVCTGIGTSVIGTTAMLTFIDRACGVIDSYCGSRYTLPFGTGTTTPPVIKDIAVKLTAYNVLMTQFTGDGENKNDWVQEWKDDAMNMLEMIRDGKLSVTDTSSVTVEPTTQGVTSDKSEFNPIFNIDDEKDWSPNSNLVEDIGDERE